jgi:hypothetical protein
VKDDAHLLQVQSSVSVEARMICGGVQAHTYLRRRDPEPTPRDTPPREPVPAEHGFWGPVGAKWPCPGLAGSRRSIRLTMVARMSG